MGTEEYFDSRQYMHEGVPCGVWCAMRFDSHQPTFIFMSVPESDGSGSDV